jgi:hypothetical protein
VHVGASLFADLGVVLFSPSLRLTGTLLLPMHATHAARARYLWEFHHGIDLLPLLAAHHSISFLLAMLVGYWRNRTLRQQWLLRRQLQRSHDARIEQLGREKERLDYERQLALKRRGPEAGAEAAALAGATLGGEPPLEAEEVSLVCAGRSLSGAEHSEGSCSAPIDALDASHTTCSELWGMTTALEQAPSEGLGRARECDLSPHTPTPHLQPPPPGSVRLAVPPSDAMSAASSPPPSAPSSPPLSIAS